MKLTKENCSLLKITSVNKETGVESISAFATHPKFKTNLRLLGLDENGEKLTFEKTLERCKANPNWRDSLKVEEHPEYGFFLRFTNSVVEEIEC